jgi:hypothetical protein
VFLNAVLLLAHTETFFLSSEQDKFVSQVVNHVVALGVELLDVKLLDAVMALELISSILFVADLAHNLHFWAISLDVIIKLSSCHVLELLSIANVATEFGALVLSMCLELTEGLPDDLRATFSGPASMRELTEVNTVSKNLVDLLQEVTSSLAIWAADIKFWGNEQLSCFVLSTASSVHHLSFVTGGLVDNISLSINELLLLIVGCNK